MVAEKVAVAGTVRVDGFAAPEFGAVADAFVATLASSAAGLITPHSPPPKEGGAAVALYVDGREVVHLWAGTADPRTGRSWTADTAAMAFSCAKGVVAVCIADLCERAAVHLDDPVSRYWPEFASHGKQDVTIRCLLSHRAGLPVIDRPLTLPDVLAWTPVVRALEAQSPLWMPGSAHKYHSMTFGWLAGELIRRITGETPGTYLRRVFAEPLGLDTWIGLPAEERGRLAPLVPSVDAPAASGSPSPDNLDVRALTLNGALPLVERGVEVFNDLDVLAAEIPAANAVTTARGLARLYAATVSDVAGDRRLSAATIDDFIAPQSAGPQWNGTVDDGRRWGAGFMLDSPPARPMVGVRSFGHDGASGSLGFADDEYRVGFGYVTNRMGDTGDDRAIRLTAAVRGCLGLPPSTRSVRRAV
jgi:CubicO group peptidase (beta-lactamase class C family)